MVLLVPVMSKIKQEAGFSVQRPATWNVCLQISKFQKQNVFLSIEQGKEGEEKPHGVWERQCTGETGQCVDLSSATQSLGDFGHGRSPP